MNLQLKLLYIIFANFATKKSPERVSSGENFCFDYSATVILVMWGLAP